MCEYDMKQKRQRHVSIVLKVSISSECVAGKIIPYTASELLPPLYSFIEKIFTSIFETDLCPLTGILWKIKEFYFRFYFFVTCL